MGEVFFASTREDRLLERPIGPVIIRNGYNVLSSLAGHIGPEKVALN